MQGETCRKIKASLFVAMMAVAEARTIQQDARLNAELRWRYNSASTSSRNNITRGGAVDNWEYKAKMHANGLQRQVALVAELLTGVIAFASLLAPPISPLGTTHIIDGMGLTAHLQVQSWPCIDQFVHVLLDRAFKAVPNLETSSAHGAKTFQPIVHSGVVADESYDCHGPGGTTRRARESYYPSIKIDIKPGEKASPLSQVTLRNLTASKWLPLMCIAVSSVCVELQTHCSKQLQFSGLLDAQIVVIRGGAQLFGCLIFLLVIRQPLTSWMGTTFEESWLLLAGAVMAFLSIFLTRFPFAESSVLCQVSPIFASIFAAIFLREQWYMNEIVGAILGFLGVVCIARGSLLTYSSAYAMTTVLGFIVALLGASLAGAAFVFVRMLGTSVKVHWAVVALYQAVFQLIFGLINMISDNQTFSAIEWHTACWALLFGAISCCGSCAMIWGMQREKTATATVVRTSWVPLCAMLVQALFYPSKGIQPTTVAGFAIILAGLLSTVIGKILRERDSQRKEEALSENTMMHDRFDVRSPYSITTMQQPIEGAESTYDIS